MHENKSKIEISVLLPVFNPNFSFFMKQYKALKAKALVISKLLFCMSLVKQTA